MKVLINQADLDDPGQCHAIVEIIQSYIGSPMGKDHHLNKDQGDQLIFQLRHHPRVLILLAREKENYCGLLIAYQNISTFSALPMLNIHDLAVLPAYQGKGIGRSLIKRAQNFAKHSGCSKITLEVRCDNKKALNLYHSEGFHEESPPMHFWIKKLRV